MLLLFLCFPGLHCPVIFQISDSETLAKREFTRVILLLFFRGIINSVGFSSLR